MNSLVSQTSSNMATWTRRPGGGWSREDTGLGTTTYNVPWASSCRSIKFRSQLKYTSLEERRKSSTSSVSVVPEIDDENRKRISREFANAIPELEIDAAGSKSVVQRLADLLDTGQFSDVQVRVGPETNCRIFKVHRLLLATASQQLCKLVYSAYRKPDEADITTLRIPDIDPDVFKLIVRFIYTDTVQFQDLREAFASLKSCKKWGLTRLTAKALEYLKNYLDDYRPTNDQMKNDLCELLMFADNGYEELNEKCWKTLLRYVNEVVPCLGFLSMDQSMVKKLLGHKDLNYRDHLGLFEAIRDWGLNQLLNNNLSMGQLSCIVEDLLKHINFNEIKDADFINTVLPSECLGKADIIAFFMMRGLEIPRDLGVNNNKQISSLMKNGSVLEFSKVCRFQRGHKIPPEEICSDHELRFRVNRSIRLLGIGFGFLFSNTDMGVTIHCQGPWEKVQWSDMIQTYCRVSWEKLKTADLRLMFSEAVRLEANHSYKVKARVGRMSAGSSEVDLWGGCRGLLCAEACEAKFHFLKAAVDPLKEVELEECEASPGLITELLFQEDSGEPQAPPARRTRQRPSFQSEETKEELQEEQPVRRRIRPVETSVVRRNYGASDPPSLGDPIGRRRRPSTSDGSSVVAAPRRPWDPASESEPLLQEQRVPKGSSDYPDYSYHSPDEEDDKVTSYYLRSRPTFMSTSTPKTLDSVVKATSYRENDLTFQPRNPSTSYVRESPSFLSRSRDSSRFGGSSSRDSAPSFMRRDTSLSRFGSGTSSSGSLFSASALRPSFSGRFGRR